MLQPDHFQATLWMLIDSDIWNRSIVGNDRDSSFKCLESISPLDELDRGRSRTAAAAMAVSSVENVELEADKRRFTKKCFIY